MSVNADTECSDLASVVPLPLGKRDVDITFFVACYNEEENIVPTLQMLTDAMRDTNLSWEAIVIDDGSTDRSAALVQDFIRDNPSVPVYCKVNPVNMGLGYCYTEGAFLGRGKYYRLICGDNVETKENLLQLLKYLGKTDIIVPCYRVHGRALGRTILSKLYTGIVNTLTGYRIGYYNGLAIHLRYNVMRWHPYSRGYGFQADLLTRLLDQGCSYQEVFLEVHERTKGKAKAMSVKNFLSVGHTLFDIFLRRISRIMYGGRQSRVRKAAACSSLNMEDAREEPEVFGGILPRNSIQPGPH
jgi:glycosyltransferase involved in cell wall biosynthesis